MKVTGAVITADIVNSIRMGTQASKEMGDRLRDFINANQARFVSFWRSDTFQCYLIDPYPAFRLVLMLRTEAILYQSELKDIPTDLKVSLAIGSIETPVTLDNRSLGWAFINSGLNLDELEETNNRVVIRAENEALNITFDVISSFTDYLFEHLTYKQAEVLKHLLLNRNQQEIAKILDKSQSTINRHVKSLGWFKMEELLNLYSKNLEQINIYGK